ncbi:MAG: FG-GAP and VCBS repeat-containing protein [Chitinophagaceae bacterium]
MLSILFFLQLMLPNKHERDKVPKFEQQVVDSAISIGYGLALGDVDGDGKPDILLADKKQYVWYRNGDWKRFVMIENLTEYDNVCIAARDLDGDGKVEVAVGAQWNPGETTDTSKSGSVHYLIRPKDPTQRWEAVELHHEPTIHRMRWAKSSDGHFYLVVLPLHGRGNKNGEGEGVKMIAYQFPKNPKAKWNMTFIDQSMHLTHNLEIIENKSLSQTDLFIAGKEGIKIIPAFNSKSGTVQAQRIEGVENSAGEIRIGNRGSKQPFIATIEPMHGVAVAVYVGSKNKARILLDDQLKDGHALATADLLGLGYDQVVAGWRVPNAENKTGIKLYVPVDKSNTKWDQYWIDENGMATEDLQVLDMNGDGKLDIVAAGRATKNLKIYWNRAE